MKRKSAGSKTVFQKRLIALRGTKSQEEVAKGIKVSRPTLSSYERDESIPDLYILKNIASYFNVSIDYLAGLSNRKKHGSTDLIDATGLSDDNITRLIEYKNNKEKQRYLYLINFLIEYADSTKLWEKLDEYISNSKADIYGELIKTIQGIPDAKLINDDEIINIERFLKEIVHYNLMQEFEKVINNIKDDYLASCKKCDNFIKSNDNTFDELRSNLNDKYKKKDKTKRMDTKELMKEVEEDLKKRKSQKQFDDFKLK